MNPEENISCLATQHNTGTSLMDIGNKLQVFLAELFNVTFQCPDILAYSALSKLIMLVELMVVPWKKNITITKCDTKTEKYEELILGLRNCGFQVKF